MATFVYRPQAAIDSSGNLVTSGSGQVFAQMTGGTALTVRNAAGLNVDTINVSSIGQTELFQVDDYPELYWRSGTYVVHIFSITAMVAAVASSEAAAVASAAAAEASVDGVVRKVNGVGPDENGNVNVAGGGGGGGGNAANVIFLDEDEPVPALTPVPSLIVRAAGYVPPVDPDVELEAIIASATTERAASATTLTLAKPVGVQDGDLLVAFLTNQQADSAAPAWTPPAGWVTLHEIFTPTDVRCSGWYGLPVPSAAALTETAFLFTASVAAGRSAGTMFRVRGANLANPVLVTAGAGTAGTDTAVLPAMTLTEKGLVLAGFNLGAVTSGNAGAPASISDSGLAKVAEVLSSDGTAVTRSGVVVYAGVKNAGTVGPLTNTWPATVGGRGGSGLAIRAAS